MMTGGEREEEDGGKRVLFPVDARLEAVEGLKALKHRSQEKTDLPVVASFPVRFVENK